MKDEIVTQITTARNMLNRGGLAKIWTDRIRKDFECIWGPAIHQLRRWEKEWPLLLSSILSFSKKMY